MYNTLSRLWNKNHDAEQIRKAVLKGWITEEEYTEITGQLYEVQ